MKLKIRVKAVLGAAVVMVGMFASMVSVNATNPLFEAIERDEPDESIISMATARPELLGDWKYRDFLLENCHKSRLKRPLFDIQYRFESPLHDAIVRGAKKEEIEHLLSTNSDLVSMKDTFGNLAVFLARDADTLECLHKFRANLDAVEEDTPRRTPLIFRHRNNHSILEFLLKHNVDINVRDIDGRTILHRLFADCFSVEGEELGNCKKSIELVMRYGGGKIINALDNDGCTSLDLLYEGMLYAEDRAARVIEEYGRENTYAYEAMKDYYKLRILVEYFEGKYSARLIKHKINGVII